MSDDFLIFAQEDPVTEGSCLAPWPILVVDDDHDIHLSTRLALKNTTLLGRPLALTHAYSAHEAFELLLKRHDFAIILLDVVMENDFAGLDLVAKIRGILGLKEVRIILRTGQPGHAPEPGIFNLHDINDYRLKTELTSNRLITALSSALRSYEQICAISANRRGLEMIVHTETLLMECTQFSQFAQVILDNASKIFDHECIGLVADTTHFSQPHFSDVGACSDELKERALAILAQRPPLTLQHRIEAHEMWLYLQAGSDHALIYLHFKTPLKDLLNTGQLASVFAANTSACLGHLRQLERLNYLAYHDELTTLGNRSWFIEQLSSHQIDTEQPYAVAIVDICRFADINDGLGYEAGNALLRAFAMRLRLNLAGSQTLLARLGNDVFALFGSLKHVNPDHLFTLTAEPLQIQHHSLPIQISVGVRLISDAQSNGLQLLEQANIALNQAKNKAHPRWVAYSPDMEAHTRWRHEVIHQLRLAFQANTLQIWYQPQINLQSNAVVGVEALMRWPSSHGFLHSPAVFIPLAEYSGLIIELGAWVLEEACLTYKAMQALLDTPFRIAVNISMPQFRTGNLVQQIKEMLARHQIPPSALELEITESIAMDEPATVSSSLTALRELGVQIAIDDFGTGFSSLGQLRALPIDSLKIDKSFVDDINGENKGIYAEMIIALAQKLHLSSVAEGVESQEQAQRLTELGCTIGQGYFYAKPMPLAELKTWLQQRNSVR
jgi:diguanylate cyclase (GGDEF)-like protein